MYGFGFRTRQARTLMRSGIEVGLRACLTQRPSTQTRFVRRNPWHHACLEDCIARRTPYGVIYFHFILILICLLEFEISFCLPVPAPTTLYVGIHLVYTGAAPDAISLRGNGSAPWSTMSSLDLTEDHRRCRTACSAMIPYVREPIAIAGW